MTTLEFPSGLHGEVRKIKGHEIAAIAEQADSGSNGFNTIMSGCWQQTLDVGPYAFLRTGDAKPDWGRLLKGDLLYGIIQLRRISLTDGDNYDFDVPCEECRAKIKWTVKLSDLTVQKLSADAKEMVRAGAPFNTSIAGRAIQFHPQCVAHEEPVARLMKRQQRTAAVIQDVLVGQIVSIEGVPNDILARWKWLSDLSMGELYDLRAAMEENDCGVQTGIEVQCQERSCRWVQEVNLPLGKRFFSPRKREKPVSSSPDGRDTSGDSSQGSPANGSGSGAPTSGGTSTAAVGTP